MTNTPLLSVQCCQYSKAGSTASIKVHQLKPDASAIPGTSAVVPFTVCAGKPAAIVCNGPVKDSTDDGRVALLGEPQSLLLEYAVRDSAGMLCSGDEALTYLQSNVHALQHSLEWDTVVCCHTIFSVLTSW